jgi:hypothetical protein
MLPHAFALRFLLHAFCVAAAMLPMTSVTWSQFSASGSDFVVRKPIVNMFAKPAVDSMVTSQVIYGTEVASLQKRGKMYEIQTADGYTGWVVAPDLLALRNRPYAAGAGAIHVSALSANIYREPDVTLHAPLMRLPWEAQLELVTGQMDSHPDWFQVRLVDGHSAWVKRGDVSLGFTPLSVDDTLRLARNFLGITYTWGGVSSFGFDCSGFTQMLVRQRGIEMPRDSRVQVAWSGLLPVQRNDLQPGDLLFFGESVAKINHTGMYLGGGEFIHDTPVGHPGVQISRLDDMPWTKLLVASRRLK